MRTAIILEGNTPVNIIVLGEGAKADEALAFYAPNIQEVTGLDPMPGVGNGWTFVDGEWVAPAEPDDE